MKIVSLLPSATEIVYALGEEVDGRSEDSVFPPQVLQKPVVVKKVIVDNMSSYEIDNEIKRRVSEGEPLYIIDEKILEGISPDIILAQDLCYVCAVSPQSLNQTFKIGRGSKVINLNPRSFWEILETIKIVGKEIGREKEAYEIEKIWKDTVREIESFPSQKRKVLFCEWIFPPFVGGHWIPDMLEIAGGEPILSKKLHPSFEITFDDINLSKPDIIMLSPCGFSIEKTLKEVDSFLEKIKIPSEVYVVDSDLFACPGPRILNGLKTLAQIIKGINYGEKFVKVR